MDVSRLVCAVCVAATILSTGCDPEQAVALSFDGQPGVIALVSSAGPAVAQAPATAPTPAQAAAPTQPTQQERNRQLKNQQLIDNV